MKQVTIDKVLTLKKIFNDIAKMVSTRQYNQALEALKQIRQSERTEKYYELLSSIYIKEEDYETAKDIVEIGLYNFLNSKILYYKLYEALWGLRQFEDAIIALARSVRLTFNNEERDKTTEKLKAMIPRLFDLIGEEKARKIISEATLVLGEGDERAFPMDKNAQSWINRYITDSKGKKYYVNLYKGYTAENINMDVRYFLKTEIVQGRNYRYTKLNLSEESIIPFSSSFDGEIELKNAQGFSGVIEEKHMQKKPNELC